MSRTILAHLADDICNLFSNVASTNALATKFVQRESKLTGKLFLSSLVSTCLSNQVFTLENVCTYLSSKIDISKQGLSKRMNNNAVTFLSEMFHTAQKYFKSKNAAVVTLLNQFTSVFLLDSTIIQLPQSMSSSYKSFGGEHSTSALKIQLMFDYVTNEIAHFDITEARSNDQGYREHLSFIKPGALYLVSVRRIHLYSI